MAEKTESEIRSFMRVLIPIQMRIEEKYGMNTIYKWGQIRLNREREFYG